MRKTKLLVAFLAITTLILLATVYIRPQPQSTALDHRTVLMTTAQTQQPDVGPATAMDLGHSRNNSAAIFDSHLPATARLQAATQTIEPTGQLNEATFARTLDNLDTAARAELIENSMGKWTTAPTATQIQYVTDNFSKAIRSDTDVGRSSPPTAQATHLVAKLRLPEPTARSWITAATSTYSLAAKTSATELPTAVARSGVITPS